MIYRLLVNILPLRAFARWRLFLGKEDAARIGERFGKPSRSRPSGFLVWAHSVSVGEVTLIMPLVERILQNNVRILLTTNTLDSAKYVARYIKDNNRVLKGRLVHQFICWDKPKYVARFLAHWKPNLTLWTESEIWPCLITKTAKISPLILMNAHLSTGSYKMWRLLRAFGIGKSLFESFAVCLPQNPTQATRFKALGVSKIISAPSLKYAAPPPPCTKHFKAMKKLLASQKIWVAVSTHKGEERKILEAHKIVGGLLVIIPRHPKRGKEVESLAQQHGFATALRSTTSNPKKLDVYVIDCLGEVGLWCRLAKMVFIGGTLVDLGGHNPLEPLNCGVKTIAFGRFTYRFGELYADLLNHNIGVEVSSVASLAKVAATHQSSPESSSQSSSQSPNHKFSIAAKKSQSLKVYLKTLAPYLDA